eukprot:Selendium_serpulae@DN6457_c0_g1_i6.p1
MAQRGAADCVRVAVGLHRVVRSAAGAFVDRTPAWCYFEKDSFIRETRIVSEQANYTPTIFTSPQSVFRAKSYTGLPPDDAGPPADREPLVASSRPPRDALAPPLADEQRASGLVAEEAEHKLRSSSTAASLMPHRESAIDSCNVSPPVGKQEKPQGGSSTPSPHFAAAVYRSKVETLDGKPVPGLEGLFLRAPRELAVPSTPLQRAAHFGGFALGMAAGSIAERVRRTVDWSRDPGQHATDPMLSSANAHRISEMLCKMRGAALKLGQMLSLQDEYLPEVLREALTRARNSADILPKHQVHDIMKNEFGKGWRDKFLHFSETPIAAASIGQVHEAVLGNGRRVAVKLQYPGVADSIESDLKNIVMLFNYSRFLPKTLFLDVLAEEIKNELLNECDYLNEADFYDIFRHLLRSFDNVFIPQVIREFTSKRVLTTEFVNGITFDKCATECSQEQRNSIGTRLLDICLHEVFVYKLMQTDPNPGNFFYDTDNNKLCLIDFGAGRSFSASFVDNYQDLLSCAVQNASSGIPKRSAFSRDKNPLKWLIPTSKPF